MQGSPFSHGLLSGVAMAQNSLQLPVHRTLNKDSPTADDKGQKWVAPPLYFRNQNAGLITYSYCHLRYYSLVSSGFGLVVYFGSTKHLPFSFMFPVHKHICAAAGHSHQIWLEDSWEHCWLCSAPDSTNVSTSPAAPLLPAWPGLQHFQHSPLWCFPLWSISSFGNGTISHELCTHCLNLSVIITLL